MVGVCTNVATPLDHIIAPVGMAMGWAVIIIHVLVR